MSPSDLEAQNNVTFRLDERGKQVYSVIRVSSAQAVPTSRYFHFEWLGGTQMDSISSMDMNTI